MRSAASCLAVTLAACGSVPEPELDLPVAGQGLAVTADSIYVESGRTLYEAPRDGGEPRAIATSAEVSLCQIESVIEVDGDVVYWLERNGYLHRVTRSTGETDVADAQCPDGFVVADGVAYWSTGAIDDATSWRWSGDSEPELLFTGPPYGERAVADGWVYGSDYDSIIRRSVDGSVQEVVYTPDRSWDWRVMVVDGYVHFWESTRDGDAWSRVPVTGGAAEVLGPLGPASGRFIIDGDVAYSGDRRVRVGGEASERWLPAGGPRRTVIHNIALDGDDLFFLAHDGEREGRVYRYAKDGAAAPTSAVETDVVNPPFL